MTEIETSMLKDSLSKVCEKLDEDIEPSVKRTKKDHISGKERLEARLISVLSCVICFDLPSGSIYQVCILSLRVYLICLAFIHSCKLLVS